MHKEDHSLIITCTMHGNADPRVNKYNIEIQIIIDSNSANGDVIKKHKEIRDVNC